MSDVLASLTKLTQMQIREVFESEQQMPENKNNARLKSWYHDAFEIALMHKNNSYLNFLIHGLELPPSVFG